jgi:PleD family two-component response regulator
MGGTIGVDSTVGVGSTFWVELRELTDAAAAAGRTKRAMPAVARRRAGDAMPRTLLYVEDNPANLMLVEQLIARRPTSAPAERRMAANRGIELARAYQPDVILMDINLPGISGVKP